MAQQVSIWRDINLVGRSQLIEKLHRMINKQKRFRLIGQAGIGKTAILEFLHEWDKGEKSSLIDARDTYFNLLKRIAEDWDLDVEPVKGKSKPNKDDYEDAIWKEEGHYLFIDNLHSAADQKIYLFKRLAERHFLSGALASKTKLRPQLKQLFWYLSEEVEVEKLNKPDMEKLIRGACKYLGSRASIEEIKEHARGLPGRAVAFALTGNIPKEDVHLPSEEIDISWVLLIFAGGIVVFRYLGRSIGATDFTLLGGAGIILVLLIRLLVQQGKEKA